MDAREWRGRTRARARGGMNSAKGGKETTKNITSGSIRSTRDVWRTMNGFFPRIASVYALGVGFCSNGSSTEKKKQNKDGEKEGRGREGRVGGERRRGGECGGFACHFSLPPDS